MHFGGFRLWTLSIRMTISESPAKVSMSVYSRSRGFSRWAHRLRLKPRVRFAFGVQALAGEGDHSG